MEKWLVVITSSFMVGYVLSRVNLYIMINIRRCGQDDNVNIRVSMLSNFINYNMKIPVIEITDGEKIAWLESVVDTANDKIETHAKREKRFLKKVLRVYFTQPRRLRKLLRAFRKYSRYYQQFMQQVYSGIYCEKLCWKTTFGSEDAALTGLGVGLLWAVKGMMVAFLQNRVTVACRPQFAVVPVFGHARFELDFSCIFRIRLGNVITATVSLFNSKGKEAGKSG